MFTSQGHYGEEGLELHRQDNQQQLVSWLANIY